jgi:hypothetical protein
MIVQKKFIHRLLHVPRRSKVIAEVVTALFGPAVILETGFWRPGTRASEVLASEPSGAGTHVLPHLPTKLN